MPFEPSLYFSLLIHIYLSLLCHYMVSSILQKLPVVHTPPYYEGGGYRCGGQSDKCTKNTGLGGSWGMLPQKSACSEIESGAI